MEFTEENIRKLFGPEAAEDEAPDRLKSYYFKSDVYEKVHNELPLRILVGHKGIGKSATFKVSFEENKSRKHVVVWIRPDDIMELCQEPASLLQMIRDWKNGLSKIIYTKVLEGLGLPLDSALSQPINYAGHILTKIANVLKDKITQSADLDVLQSDIINGYLKVNKIFVYIDDLDRGWKGLESDIQRISALLNAARDLSNDNPGLCIRISLRSDVYFLVRTSDESTDKIESSVIWYTWTQHQILCMLAKRVQAFRNAKISDKQLLRLPQFKIATYFSDIFDDRFHASGKWSDIPTYKMLASMIRRRPRDLVKLCTLSARTAYENNHEKIQSDDWLDNFDYYSQERIQDTVNEYKSELPDIERLLLGMKPSNRERHTSEEFIYTTDELLKKIDIITGKTPFRFSKGKVASSQELAAFMYKINFLVARKNIEGTDVINRRYFEDQKYLSNRFVDFGYKWEVHPAFRWALYPDGGKDIFASLRVDDEI